MLNKERDMYAIQEDQKYLDPPSKWYCNFCGKGFLTEHYLDQHFTNRHNEYVRQVSKCVIMNIFKCLESHHDWTSYNTGKIIEINHA